MADYSHSYSLKEGFGLVRVIFIITSAQIQTLTEFLRQLGENYSIGFIFKSANYFRNRITIDHKCLSISKLPDGKFSTATIVTIYFQKSAACALEIFTY